MSNARSPELARDGGRNASSDYEPRTYRGSAIDDLLPRIRAELGADAIVVRQREGLDGGVGGFFQRKCVEVVARRAAPVLDAYDGQAGAYPAYPDYPPYSAPSPRAPAIRELMRVASPFIEQLHAAQVAEPEPMPMPAPAVSRTVAAPDLLAAFAPRAEEQPVTGAFGASAYTMTADTAMHAIDSVVEQAARVSPPAEAPVVAPEAPVAAPTPQAALPEADIVIVDGPQPDGAEPADPGPDPERIPAERTGAAAAQERSLVAAGIAAPLAAELVGATVSHVLPFGPTRRLKRVLGEALARRIPIAPPVAAGGYAIAFVGAGGSGKTLCAARLATAYAQHSDLEVTVTSLATAERGAALRELLESGPLDVLDARSMGPDRAFGERVLTVVDTPAVSPAAPGEVKKLAAELKRLGSPAVHVAVPATLSTVAVRALLDGFAALEPAAIVLTHLDEVAHAGPVIDEAISRGIAISYTSDGSSADGFAPADAAALAARVLA
jgi:flagellar biosynthesis GTPase FlhF